MISGTRDSAGMEPADDTVRHEPEEKAQTAYSMREGLERLKQMCDIVDSGVEARKLSKPSEFVEQVLQTQVSADVCNLERAVHSVLCSRM